MYNLLRLKLRGHWTESHQNFTQGRELMTDKYTEIRIPISDIPIHFRTPAWRTDDDRQIEAELQRSFHLLACSVPKLYWTIFAKIFHCTPSGDWISSTTGSGINILYLLTGPITSVIFSYDHADSEVMTLRTRATQILLAILGACELGLCMWGSVLCCVTGFWSQWSIQHQFDQRSVTHDILRYINILTYLLTYLLTCMAVNLNNWRTLRLGRVSSWLLVDTHSFIIQWTDHHCSDIVISLCLGLRRCNT